MKWGSEKYMQCNHYRLKISIIFIFTLQNHVRDRHYWGFNTQVFDYSQQIGRDVTTLSQWEDTWILSANRKTRDFFQPIGRKGRPNKLQSTNSTIMLISKLLFLFIFWNTSSCQFSIYRYIDNCRLIIELKNSSIWER